MTTSDRFARPTSADAWWDGIADGHLSLLRCGTCGNRWLPWLDTCPACGARDATAERASGHGRIHSWVTVRYPPGGADIPRTTVAVALDEGPILYGRLRAEHGEPEPDQRVRAVYVAGADGPVLEFVPERDPLGD